MRSPGSETEKKQFVPDELMNDERGVLQHLENMGGGRMKKAIATLMLGSSLLLSGGQFAKSEAAGPQPGTKTEGQQKNIYAEQAGIILERMKFVVEVPRQGPSEWTEETRKNMPKKMIDAWFAIAGPDRAAAVDGLEKAMQNADLGLSDSLRSILEQIIKAEREK